MAKDIIFSPNPDGDQDRGWALLAVCFAFLICAFVSTALRVWVRTRLTHNLGWDDIHMMIAMTTTLIGAGLITTEVLDGLGRHEYYLQPGQRRMFAVLGWADWIQTFITLMLTKTSICLFLLRIVEGRKSRIVLYSLIGSLILFSSVFLFLFIGICRPLEAYWDVGVDGICFSDRQFENIIIAQGDLSIVSDLICAAFPILFLRNLQISMRTKIALFVLMGLGVITAACCTVRTALAGTLVEEDITWAVVPNVAWRLPEVNIGIFCANAPILRPLYLFLRGNLQSQRTATSNGHSKDRILPNSAMWGTHTKLQGQDSASWKKGSGDGSVSLEIGLPVEDHDDAKILGRC